MPHGTDLSSVSSVLRSIRSLFAAYIEGACLKWLFSELPFLIPGAEKARHDCVLDVSDRFRHAPEDDYSAQLFDVIQPNKREKVAIGLDVKTIVPFPDRRRVGHYGHGIWIREDQGTCAAFIVFSSAAPDLVALLPMEYLLKGVSTSSPAEFIGRAIPATSARTEPFALEWSPFVMPIPSLPAALESLRDFCREGQKLWCNPHNDLQFRSLSRPSLQELAVLLPSGSNDLVAIQILWRATKTASAQFGVRRPVLQPSVADLILVHKPTGTESALELKCGEVRGLKLGIVAYRREAKGIRRTFRFYDKWEFIVGVTSSEPPEFFVISRDEFEERWFWMSDGELEDLEDGMLWFECSSRADLHNHLLRSTDRRTTSLGLDRVFGGYKDRDMLRARRRFQRPPQVPAFAAIEQVHGWSEDVQDDFKEATEEGNWDELRKYHNKFQYSHQHSLEAQLQQSGRQGRLMCVKRHPSGSMIYVPAVQSDTSFYDLDLETPMVFVNVCYVIVNDKMVAHDRGWTTDFLPATHGPSESVYVLLPRVHTRPAMRRRAFVVPSWLINTDFQRRRSQQFIDKKRPPHTHKPLHLSGGVSIEKFACSYDRAMEKIARTADMYPDRLFKTRLDAAEQFLQVYEGTSHLTLKKVGSVRMGPCSDVAIDESSDDEDDGEAWYV